MVNVISEPYEFLHYGVAVSRCSMATTIRIRFVEAANACAVEAPSDVDEWIVSGLTPEPSVSLLFRNSIYSLDCPLTTPFRSTSIQHAFVKARSVWNVR